MTDVEELKASLRPLKRHKVLWSFQPIRPDEIPLESGDVVLVATEYEDGWSRGMKLETKEVGFFPSSYVKPTDSPIRSFQAHGQVKMSDIDLKFAAKDPARRAKVVWELYTSEKEYCERLRVLHETFVIPLGKFSVVNPQDYSVIFSRIAPMLNLAEEMRVNLESRTEAWHDPSTQVGDLFQYKEKEMMELFVSYASKHVIGQKALEHLMSNEKFITWLAKAEHQCGRTLNALMIEAIQRPPRYVLLLQDLLNSTQRDHPDYHNLEVALEIVSEVTQECNQKTKSMQAELALLMISKQFPQDEVNLTNKKQEKSHKTRRSRYSSRQVMDPAELEPKAGFEDKTAYASFFHITTGCRELVREGSLMRGKSNFTDLSERYLFLLTDMLLVAQPINLRKKAYKLKDRVPLVQAWITDQLVEGVRVPENAFVLGTPHDVHRFVANSQNAKLWFNDLRKLIFEQKKAFSELLTHLTLPDEVYYTMKAKVALPYLASGADELTLKREDAVNVVGFIDSRGTWQPGLYCSEEMFDPSDEWFFGVAPNNNFGWFPKGCVKLKRPEANTELPALPVAKAFEIRKRMLIKSQRELVASVNDQERFVKVAAAEGQVIKTIPLEPTTTVTDIVKRFYPTKDVECFNWHLIETSSDRTIERMVPADENLCLRVDFWGKMRSQMTFQLQQGSTIE